MSTPFVIPLAEFKDRSAQLVGQLSQHLSHLHQARIPVVPTFAVTSQATRIFFNQTEIRKAIEEPLSQVNLLKYRDLEVTADHIRKIILHAAVPEAIARDVAKYYNRMASNSYVQLALSATDALLPESVMFQDTDEPIRVKGDANLIEALKKAWSRFYSAEAIAYRYRHRHPHNHYNLTILVQALPKALVSGTMTTIDNIHQSKNLINIEAVWGLADELLAGTSDPDFYQVEKFTWRVDHEHVATQDFERPFIKPDRRVRVKRHQRQQAKLTLSDLVWLAKIGHKIQQQTYYPQTVYWVKSKDQFLVLRTDDVESETKPLVADTDMTTHQSILGSGESASPGLVSGPARLIFHPRDLTKLKHGEIIVAKSLTQSLTPGFRQAKALVTEHGGQSAHSALVARELHLPCVTGVARITDQVRTGDVITVNGTSGKIFAGAVDRHQLSSVPKVNHTMEARHKLLTKLWLLTSDITQPPDIVSEQIDGLVGLDASSLLKDFGVHPSYLVENDTKRRFEKKFVQSLDLICEQLGERPVYYHLLEYRGDQLYGLKHSRYFERHQASVHSQGVSRLIREKKWLEYELKMIHQVRQDHASLQLVIPLARSAKEVTQLKQVMKQYNLSRGNQLQIWVSLQVPSLIWEIPTLATEGVDGVIVYLDELALRLQGIPVDSDEPIDLTLPPIISAISALSRMAKQAQLKVAFMCQRLALPHQLIDLVPEQSIHAVGGSFENLNQYQHQLITSEQHYLRRRKR